MKTECNEYIDIVNELNDNLYKIFGDDIEYFFSYETNGYIDVILFGDHILWNSDNDDRMFIEEKNDYEPLSPFIKKQFNQYVDMLNKMKFKRIK
jgi:hypothetical protein